MAYITFIAKWAPRAVELAIALAKFLDTPRGAATKKFIEEAWERALAKAKGDRTAASIEMARQMATAYGDKIADSPEEKERVIDWLTRADRLDLTLAAARGLPHRDRRSQRRRAKAGAVDLLTEIIAELSRSVPDTDVTESSSD